MEIYFLNVPLLMLFLFILMHEQMWASSLCHFSHTSFIVMCFVHSCISFHICTFNVLYPNVMVFYILYINVVSAIVTFFFLIFLNMKAHFKSQSS